MATATDKILRFTAGVDLAAKADKPATVSIVGYSGGILRLRGEWGPTVIDLSGLKLPDDIPLLTDHTNAVDALAGQGTPSIKANQLLITGELARDSVAGAKVIALAKAGVNLRASVGVSVQDLEQIPPDKSRTVNGRKVSHPDGLTLVTASELMECSFTPIPADAGSNVSINASKGRTMPDIIDDTDESEDTLSPREQKRIRAINAYLATELENVPPQVATRLEAAATSAIADGSSVREAQVEMLRAARPIASEIGRPGPRRHRVSDRNVLECALALHAGLPAIDKAYDEHTLEAANGIGCRHILDIARLCADGAGKEYVARSPDSVLRAAFSSADFPILLSNIANKSLETAYRAFPSMARLLARRLTANDFKTHVGIRVTGDLHLEKTGEAGEIKHGTLGEMTFEYRIDTFSRIIGLTRQSLINDDQGGLMDLPAGFGRGAANAVEELFWQLVLSVLGTHYTTGNANKLTVALDGNGLASAVQLFLEFQDNHGKPVNSLPRFLAVPPALKARADELFTSRTFQVGGGSTTASDRVTTANAFYGLYQPLPVPWIGSKSNLAGAADDHWFLFGDPTDVASFGLAYLNNSDLPVIETIDQAPNVLGMYMRAYMDFGVCEIDKKIGSVFSDPA